MGLKEEILPYIDGNGLVAPNLTGPQGQGSDNGPMFSSELYVMLAKLGELSDQDKLDFARLIGQCVAPNGMLHRVPFPPGSGQEGPDDHYGVLNGCKILGNVDIPRRFLKAVVKYLGFLNNVEPGKFTKESFLIRQPQLLACMVAAAFPSFRNPLHFCIRLLALPVFFVAAVTLAISCVGADIGDTDSRRLSWHVWQCTKPVSLMCWLTGKLWRRRLYKDYPNGMKGVASIYYRDNHPFGRYWITD